MTHDNNNNDASSSPPPPTCVYGPCASKLKALLTNANRSNNDKHTFSTQLRPSIMQQTLSTHADCQSPILAIHSYKQCCLNSKSHSNNIDVIKPAATPADNKEIKANKKPSIKKNKARNNSRSSFDINFTSQ